jgi:hypothetical protein
MGPRAPHSKGLYRGLGVLVAETSVWGNVWSQDQEAKREAERKKKELEEAQERVRLGLCWGVLARGSGCGWMACRSLAAAARLL